MRRLLVIGTAAAGLALLATLSLPSGAAGTPARASGTLQLHAVIGGTFAPTNPECTQPPGDFSFYRCFDYIGEGLVPGLGAVSERGVMVYSVGSGSCPVDWRYIAVLTVAGKGEIELTETVAGCWVVLVPSGPATWAATGGSGIYAGASGAGTTDVTAREISATGTYLDRRIGTLTVPGLDFDLTPPVLSSAVSKTVRVPKKAKRVRVRYAVRAQDAVDGSIPVTCKPKSGSSFKIGRTKVSCTATDSSANTATATFTVTVKRRH